MSVKIIQVQINDGRYRTLDVVGFDARQPTMCEQRAVLTFAKTHNIETVCFPGQGPARLTACSTCGNPVNNPPNYATSARCFWCMTSDGTITTSIRVVGGGTLELDPTELEARAQWCESMALKMMEQHDRLKKLADECQVEPVEVRVVFYVPVVPQTGYNENV